MNVIVNRMFIHAKQTTPVVERSIESRGKTGKGLVRPDQSFSGFAPAFDASFF
jgi:hypothetical protein